MMSERTVRFILFLCFTFHYQVLCKDIIEHARRIFNGPTLSCNEFCSKSSYSPTLSGKIKQCESSCINRGRPRWRVIRKLPASTNRYHTALAWISRSSKCVTTKRPFASIESIELQESGLDNLIPSSKKRKSAKGEDSGVKGLKENKDEIIFVDEHPLRTDEWKVSFRGAPGNDPFQRVIKYAERTLGLDKLDALDSPILNSKKIRPKDIKLRFNRNGFCKIMQFGDVTSGGGSESDRDVTLINRTTNFRKGTFIPSSVAIEIFPHVGSWYTRHGCVFWNIPIWMSIQETNVSSQLHKDRREVDNGGIDQACIGSNEPSLFKLTTLHFNAEVHVNKFGEHPRMIKGIVTRERFNQKNVSQFLNKMTDNSQAPRKQRETAIGGVVRSLRPVIGQFKGAGIGEDTLDLEYKNRGVGLYKE